MVSTHLKNISQSQNGNLPQIGVKIKKYLKPPPRDAVYRCAYKFRFLHKNQLLSTRTGWDVQIPRWTCHLRKEKMALQGTTWMSQEVSKWAITYRYMGIYGVHWSYNPLTNPVHPFTNFLGHPTNISILGKRRLIFKSHGTHVWYIYYLHLPWI